MITCMARWLDIGQITVLGQHAAILTKQAWLVKNLLSFVAKRNFFLKAGNPDWVQKAYRASHNSVTSFFICCSVLQVQR